jgi:hypothetical protein
VCSPFTTGDWLNCTFTAKHAGAIIAGDFLVMNCVFQSITTDQQGGGGSVQGRFIGINTVWRLCNAQLGGGLAIQGISGVGTLLNCLFSECGHAGAASTGGALAIMSGAFCECEDCSFAWNTDGGAAVTGLCSLSRSNVTSNSGPFGGISVTNNDASTDYLHLLQCQFAGNSGETSSGNQVSIYAATTFSAFLCSFFWLDASSLYFSEPPTSASLGSNCFIGDGTHISAGESISISVVGRLCFSNSESSAIAANVNLSAVDGDAVIVFDCSSCFEPDGPPATETVAASLTDCITVVSATDRQIVQDLSGCYTFLDCDFRDLITSDSYGGALYLDSAWSRVFVLHCQFLRCQCPGIGGAAYIQLCQSVAILDFRGIECSAPHSAFCQLITDYYSESSIDVNESICLRGVASVENTFLTKMESMVGQGVTLRSVNFSFNYAETLASAIKIEQHSSLSIDLCRLHSNSPRYLLVMEYSGASDSIFSCIELINNTVDGASCLAVNFPCTFRDCLFRSNSLETLIASAYISGWYTTVTITLLRCIFDVTDFSTLTGVTLISQSCSVGIPLDLSIYRLYCPFPTSMFTASARISPERPRILRFGLFFVILGARYAEF